jgi:hypothetical protein
MLIHFDSSGDQFEATDSPYHIIIMSESNCTLEPKPAKNVGSVEKSKVSGRNPRYFNFVKHTRGSESDPTIFQGLGSQGINIYIHVYIYYIIIYNSICM